MIAIHPHTTDWSTRYTHSASASVISFFFFSSRRRHTRYIGDWSSDVCSSDLCRPCPARLPSRAPQRLGRTRAPDRGEHDRSEERRVGKECRTGRAALPKKKSRAIKARWRFELTTRKAHADRSLRSLPEHYAHS